MKRKFLIFFLALAASAGTMFAENVIFSEPFSASQGSFTIDNKSLSSGLTYVWKWRSADYGMVASAYVSSTNHESESWLISPAISLVDYSAATLSFDHAINKGAPTNFEVKISADGGSTWDDLSISQWPAGNSWTFLNATASLNSYVGNTVEIAFVYVSTTSLCPQWEIKNFLIAGTTPTPDPDPDPFPTPDYERVQIGDLYYNLDGTNHTAEVTYKSLTGDYNVGWGIKTANIPSSVTYNSKTYSVTSIGDCAFCRCSRLTSVTIPNSVTSIGEWAFESSTGLTSVTIPNSVTSIGVGAFESCSSLTSVTIGNSVTSIDNAAFSRCSNIIIVVWNAKNGPSYNFGSQVTSFTFGNEVEIIPAGLCNGMTNLTSVTIPNSVTSIGERAFFDCSGLTSVTIPNSVTSIGSSAFSGCTGLTSVTIGNSVTSIGSSAFEDCGNDGNLVLPASLKTIGDYAFKGWTKIRKINIPNEVTSIGAHAFDSCILVTSIYLGYQVEEIGDYAFKGCIRVNDITSMKTITPVVYENTLSSISDYAYLYVPAGSKRTYQLDPYWGRFDIHEIASEDATLTKGSVTVEANDDNAIFTWPTNTEAASYTLQITKDGVVFCTLVFNANGQLTGIAFAPGRNGTSHAPAATMSVAGMSFTVIGLNVASKYAYRLAVADDASEELIAYRGEFATTGYDGEVNPGGNPEGIEDVFTDEHKASKILHNGQIFILRGEKVYTLQGKEVK